MTRAAILYHIDYLKSKQAKLKTKKERTHVSGQVKELVRSLKNLDADAIFETTRRVKSFQHF